MSRVDEFPPGPEIAESLEAIDATLAGDPVDPSHAELAELALLLAGERPEPSDAFARELDDLIKGRFARSPGSRRRRRWLFAPAATVALAASVAVVMVLASGNPGGSSGASTPSVAAPAQVRSAPESAAASSGAASSTASAATSSASSSAAALPAPASPAGVAGAGVSLAPPNNGRKVIQSANLNLSVAPDHVDDVAQQVFNVIGAQKGVVNRSTVTATGGSDGYAMFQLTVPSANLGQTMADLSRLRGANVVSRTDITQDVNGQFVGDQGRLADARALRTALLKQLANAVTTAQVDSLTAQIHDAEASISSDQAALRALNGQVNSSQITVTINASQLPVAAGSSFTIGKAAHDAGRVLTVAAGVALIGLAALVPVGLVAAMAWWAGMATRRRRRERALDLA